MKKKKTSNIEHPTPNIQYVVRDGDEEWEGALHDGDAPQRKFDLEERLLTFACEIIDLSEKLPSSRAGNHVAGQILRSGTAPYPNHGEAEDAESREDFIHKLKICLKELRETRRWARLVSRKNWAKGYPALSFVLNESDELIRIFYSSIQTAKRNILGEKRSTVHSSRYSSTDAG
ncbi:MAG TPA: four helix bundle protein [Candidatus Polarisedimenticolia bacterium]|nr:four helix bundle protein [Candidatus Polarisedimenticolia bacterium]